jgi:GcrA cell cycle regulator
MSWSDERVEKLKKMWSEGQSASQIAKELGGVTRNAVIGKVHRLGLSNRNGSGNGTVAEAPAEDKPAAKPRAKARPAAAPQKPAAPEPAEAAAPAPDHDDAPAEPEPEAEPAAAGEGQPVITAGQPLPPQPAANEVDPEALAKVSEVEKKARKLTLMELTERTCKWPVGDPATDDFWFCGLPVQAGKPYCEAHVGVAFQPMSSRRDRKR